jgi:hypothetical protein
VKRANPRGSQLVRGFWLGMLYAQGVALTTDRIRREMGASRATAKRDLAQIAELVNVTPSKVKPTQREHFTKVAL